MNRRVIVYGKFAILLAMASAVFNAPGFPDWMTRRPSAEIRLCAAIATADLRGFDEALADGASPANRGASGTFPLSDAASLGELKMARRLIAAGADINVRDDQGMTPIMLAAERDHAAVVEMLIRCHADLRCTDSSRRTALDIAIESDCPNAARALRRAGLVPICQLTMKATRSELERSCPSILDP